MAKSKVDMKDFLLKKGEYIALGIAGVVLLLLLVGMVSTWVDAANPIQISEALTKDAKQIHNTIKTGQQSPAELPPWATKKSSEATPAKFNDFKPIGLPFDPIAKPDTKRENPQVVGIEQYEPRLVRGPMKGYDIIYESDGTARIAVRVEKRKGEFDQAKMKAAANELKSKGRKGVNAYRQQQQHQQQAQNNNQFGGGPGFGGPGGGGPGFGGPGGGRAGGMSGSRGPGGYGFGDTGGYGGGAQRSDVAISYIPLDDIDKAIAENKPPATTVIPLRMVVVNATVPLKKQLEEVKRAMRLKTLAEAYEFVHFDGFEVQRRVTDSSGFIIGGGGQRLVDVAKDKTSAVGWANYDYDQKYVELIDTRKLSDHFEGSDRNNPRSAFLPYFYRYEEALVMPLPELVPELGTYPPVELPSITAAIDKMIAANTQKVDPSDLQKRLEGKSGGKKSWIPKTAESTGASTLIGSPGASGMSGPKSGAGGGQGFGGAKGGGGVLEATAATEIEHLLVRFVDCDIKPGHTYEYKIRLRMINPNFGHPETMGNPRLATEEKYKVLLGPWFLLEGALSVPSESFLFAYDPATYRKHIEEDYKDQRALQQQLQVKDNQAVVERVTWLENVRTDASGQREPIGGWVTAEIPVGRGELIGKKTYLKLPLWSSEADQYVLRELSASIIPRRNQAHPPKGWLVDFSSNSVLVDFEGGRVKTKASGGRMIDEDVGTELLIVQPDGSLLVRSSLADTRDGFRIEATSTWDKWVKEVETRPAAAAGTGTGTGSTNAFDRKN